MKECGVEMGATESGGDRLQRGTLIDDFEVVEEIGAGGISRVYRARQRSLGRDVALKVTERHDRDSGTSVEGRVLAALRHENIVSVFSEVVTDSCRVLAMPLVEGPSLVGLIAELHTSAESVNRLTNKDCLRQVWQLTRSDSSEFGGVSCGTQSNLATASASTRRRRWFPALIGHVPGGVRDDVCAFACQIVRQLALALQHAHEQGIFHGDVKPANVLFSTEGKPLLTDFNVSGRTDGWSSEAGDAAALIDDTCSRESTDSPVGGTLLYMAPEKLAIVCGYGPTTKVDGRADLYSLGLVLFEMLTGQWPFPESNIGRDPLLAPRELYASRLSSPVEFPDSGVRIPPPMRAIVRRCLEPDPEDRYQSASQLADDLLCLLDCRPIRWAEPPTVRHRASCFLLRHQLASVVGALIIGLVAAFATSGDEQLDAALAVPADNTQRYAEASRWEQSGRDALAANQFDRAAIDLLQAVTLTPKNATAQHNLGIALFRTRRFAEAKAAFDTALSLGARSGRAYSYRAATLLALGDLAGARADFELARRIASDAERQEIETNYQTFLSVAAVQR